MSEDQEQQDVERQVAEIMQDYGYKIPYNSEAYILCKRFVQGGNNSQADYLAFKKIAKVNKIRADNRKYSEMQARREGVIDTYTDV